MDFRFLAVIILIAALMEMLAKMARKRRGEEEGLEERIEPRRPADPLAGVLEEMQRLTRGDEGGREVGPEAPELVVRERRSPGGEMGSGVSESPREPVAPVRPPPRERAATDDLTPHSPPERATEPATLRGQIERMFDPLPQQPAVPVVVEEPSAPPDPWALPKPVVAPRDRSPRPVEVRPREVRPREARDIAERAWTEEREVSTDAPKTGDDLGRPVETRWGGEGVGQGLGSVRDLRRLVVAREVLGPPLALRGEEPLKDR